MNNPSVRHHYLPRNYLRGFTDEKDGFFIYDKQADKIFKSSPSSTFFENNLNTIVSPQGEASDWLEECYTEMENLVWRSLDAIRNSANTTLLDFSDKINLSLFLSFLHWRLPSNREAVENLSKEAFQDQSDVLDYLTFADGNGNKAPESIIEDVRSSSGFKKAMRVILSFAPFLKDKDLGENLHNWQFLYLKDNKGWYIVGDNPIITEGRFDHDPVQCLKEFVFPVSERILLVSTRIPIREEFPLKMVVLNNTAIIERARRFVACHDRGFLELLVENYKSYVQFGKTNLIIPGLFQMLQI